MDDVWARLPNEVLNLFHYVRSPDCRCALTKFSQEVSSATLRAENRHRVPSVPHKPGLVLDDAVLAGRCPGEIAGVKYEDSYGACSAGVMPRVLNSLAFDRLHCLR